MPLFKKGDKEVFQIHIPRTAGRYIRNLFMNAGFDYSYTKFEDRLEGVSVPHLYSSLYNCLPIENATHFAVVRHPLDRFKDAIRPYIYNNKLWVGHFGAERDWSYEEFKNLIDKLIEDDVQPTSTGVVFYVPQSKFVTDKTYIWKFEDGFEQDFLDWIKENIGVSLSIEGYDKNTWKVKTFAHLIHPWYYIQPVISQQVNGHIKRYYKEDYETFDYK